MIMKNHTKKRIIYPLNIEKMCVIISYNNIKKEEKIANNINNLIKCIDIVKLKWANLLLLLIAFDIFIGHFFKYLQIFYLFLLGIWINI